MPSRSVREAIRRSPRGVLRVVIAINASVPTTVWSPTGSTH